MAEQQQPNEAIEAKTTTISCFDADSSDERAKYPALTLVDKTSSGNIVAKPNEGFLERHESDSRLKSAYFFESNGNKIKKNNWSKDLWTLLNSQHIVVDDYTHPEKGVGYLFTEKDDESDSNTYFVDTEKLQSSIISAELVHFMRTGSSFATEKSINDSTDVHVPMLFHHCGACGV